MIIETYIYYKHNFTMRIFLESEKNTHFEIMFTIVLNESLTSSPIMRPRRELQRETE